MPRKCICDWQECKEFQRILKAAGHVLSGHKDLFFNENDPESQEYKQPVFDSFKSYETKQTSFNCSSSLASRMC